MGKNQLHQLLAVEQDRRGRASEIIQEAVTLFQKKEDHLDGFIRTYHPKDDKGDTLPPEQKLIVTTVAAKMQYANGFIIKAINAQLSKEETNASGLAKAELIVDDVNFGEFTATSLLALEQHLQKLLGVYRVIPTIDPVKRWMPDPSQDNTFITETEVKHRTNKVEDFRVIVPATPEHPAQIAKIVKDEQVGTWETVYSSGKITPAQKSELLSRIDNLIDAVKKARAKANQAEVKQMKTGKALLEYINNGIL